MTREEILGRIRATLVETFEVDEALVTEDALLIDTLDLDSIDAIDMAVKLQEMTGQRVVEQDLRQLRTVGDVVSLVERMVRSQG